MMSLSFVAIKPEIVLAVFAMVLLVFGAIRGDKAARSVMILALVALAVSFVALICAFHCPTEFRRIGPDPIARGPIILFGGMFVLDGFAYFVKMLILAASFLALLMSCSALERDKILSFEYPVLILFAALGMMLMVSAGDWLSLYVGLELQSLTLYILAAFQRDNAKSSESGLKYFVLGALSSGLILYGISLIYGMTGTIQFAALSQIISSDITANQSHLVAASWLIPDLLMPAQPPLGLTFGVVFICAALAFKVSAVPFHMWTPDVYEGAPTPVTAFFASAPKLAALALFTRVLLQPLIGLEHQWQQVIVFAAVASMLLGSFAGLAQSNVKRLLAYSSIANAGYALVGLAVGGTAGVQALLIYLAIYVVNTLGAFGVVLCLRRQGKACEQMTDLAGLHKTNPMLAFAMAMFMFSLAGVPPLAGFFGKYFIFLAAVHAHMVPLAIIGVLSSVVAAYYYLRIIKLMYFDDATQPIDTPDDAGLKAVLGLTSALVLLFILWPAPLVDSALVAAQSLIGG